MVARVERGYTGSDLVDHAHPLVPKNAAWRTRRNIALEDVQVGSTDSGTGDFHNCVGWRVKLRNRPVLNRFHSGTLIDQRLHHSPLTVRFALTMLKAQL